MTRKAVVTYVPVIKESATGHYRSFRNAIFDLALRSSSLQILKHSSSDIQKSCWLERRNGSGEVKAIAFAQAVDLAERLNLLSHGAPLYEADEPDAQAVAEAFERLGSRATLEA